MKDLCNTSKLNTAFQKLGRKDHTHIMSLYNCQHLPTNDFDISTS